MSFFSDFDYNDLFKYKTANIDLEDKWKIYLFQNFSDNLKQRLDEMIQTSDNKLFYSGIRYEYGYFSEKNLSKAFSLYEEGAKANSIDYLSMIRLYDIYHNSNNKFNFIYDKNIEIIYLLKSFAYLPISFFVSDIKKNKFPMNINYAIKNYFSNNITRMKNTFNYLDQLINSGKYNNILSQDDCNLIKGFIEGYVNYRLNEDDNSLNLLVALSLEENYEANIRLIIIYLEYLININDNDENKIATLKTKIYDLFQPLIEAKYFKIYEDYGLFLYNKMRMFDIGLEIFKEGYENNRYNCAIYYFQAFTKSENQSIYDINNFNSQKFINIFQTLIDAFIVGKYISLENMFDFFYIISKKYNLKSELSDKYMKYLDEIGLICLSFIDKKNGNENIIKYNPYIIDYIKHSAYHALGMIYLYGLTNKLKKNLLKAEKCLKKASQINEYAQPYYYKLIYKIRKKLFNIGAFEDENDLILLGNEVFKLYDKYKTYKKYGNSYYYMFGKLYEKGIGTKKDDKMAYNFYQKGCHSLNSIYDTFIIVYKRYLCLKIINSDKFKNLFQIGNNSFTYDINLKLSVGSKIKFTVNDNMTISDVKNELYKRIELQNLHIQVLLCRGQSLQDNITLRELKIKNNEIILVMVRQNNRGDF